MRIYGTKHTWLSISIGSKLTAKRELDLTFVVLTHTVIISCFSSLQNFMTCVDQSATVKNTNKRPTIINELTHKKW